MKRLEIKYKDGSSSNITNKSKNATNSVFKSHIELINHKRVKSATIFTYPIKDHKPLIIIADGKIINALEDNRKI